ncbi:MAG: CTP synthase [Nanoarchaeota archaeon]
MLGIGKSNEKKKRRFIVITGGVISGLGKGVITASIGKNLQVQGYKVTTIKIDPYLNVDAGTMRPTEHGEVWVTDDGGETDQDFGTYERFLGKSFSKNNNITTGQVYQTVIGKERNLEFNGKCVQVIPHIPEEAERRIRKIAEDDDADFVIIEIGGTIGDYENVLFLIAVRRMQLIGDPISFIHVVYLPVPETIGEMKTKPAQHSVRRLNEEGIQPDFIITRASVPVDDVRKGKLSVFCNIKPEQIVSSPDLKYIYELPLIFEKQNFTENLLSKFGLKYKKTGGLKDWEALVDSMKHAEQKVKIAIVGKYFDTGNFTLEDSYVSVIEAIKHAAWHKKLKPEIVWMDSKEFEEDESKLKRLDDMDGVIIPGGFGSSGVEGKIKTIEYIRKNKIPFLGLCYGMQMAVIEYARNVCGMDANSSEINQNVECPVIDILPEQKELIKNKQYGATMRLGAYEANLKEGSVVHDLYGKNVVSERHRHRYEVNPEYIQKLEEKGLIFSGVSPDRKLMEFLELPKDVHPFFVATQAHPEFTSRVLEPNPLFVGFIEAAMKK